jgi:hypothetical protein
MAIATIGGVPFRINPSQVSWTYDVDTNVIPTIGGRVVQILGITLGDMTIQGMYGVDRANQQESWVLAQNFTDSIANLVEIQSALPSAAQLSGVDTTPMQPTHRFFFDDTADTLPGYPSHHWDFQVYVKGLIDLDEDGSYVIGHRTGKYSYRYQLTLFIVEDNTGTLAKVAQDAFLDRLATGVGWKQSDYNGPMTLNDLQTYLTQNSPDSTIHGLVLQEFENASQGPTAP